MNRWLFMLSLLPSVCWAAHASADVSPSVETELQNLFSAPSEQLISSLRFYSASHPALDAVVAWRQGQRLFPPEQQMLTFSESRDLAAHSQTFNALRSSAEFRQSGRAQTQVLSANSTGIRCWQSGASQTPLDICVLGKLPQPAASLAGPTHRIKSMPATWGLPLIAALCVLGFLFGIQRIAREWVHDIRQPLSNLRLNLALLPRFPSQREQLQADMALELQKLDNMLGALTHKLPRFASWSHQTQAQAQQPLNVVLNSVIRSYCHRLQGVGCELQVDLRTEVQQQVAVASLQRIAGNIIDNCIRHAPGSVLSISTYSDFSSAPCTHINFACTAIPRHALVDQRTNSGLGLRSSKRLALKHKWQWSITRTHGEFHVRLRIPNTELQNTDGCKLC